MSESALIYTAAEQCLELLERFTCGDDVDLSREAHKTMARFNRWCDSVGARVEGPQSLDERLRDARRVKELVLNCLGSINTALRGACAGEQVMSYF
jgi:hypothetical protein